MVLSCVHACCFSCGAFCSSCFYWVCYKAFNNTSLCLPVQCSCTLLHHHLNLSLSLPLSLSSLFPSTSLFPSPFLFPLSLSLSLSLTVSQLIISPILLPSLTFHYSCSLCLSPLPNRALYFQRIGDKKWNSIHVYIARLIYRKQHEQKVGVSVCLCVVVFVF